MIHQRAKLRDFSERVAYHSVPIIWWRIDVFAEVAVSTSIDRGMWRHALHFARQSEIFEVSRLADGNFSEETETQTGETIGSGSELVRHWHTTQFTRPPVLHQLPRQRQSPVGYAHLPRYCR